MSDQYNEREGDIQFPYKEKSLQQMRDCALERECEQARHLLGEAYAPSMYKDAKYGYSSEYEYYVGAVSDAVKRKTGCALMSLCAIKCELEPQGSESNQVT